MAGNTGNRGPTTRAASKGGFKLPPATKKTYKKPKPPKPKAVTCGANKRGGGKCNQPAGWGTNHPGIGRCKIHAGSVPNHVKAAASAEYRKLLGNPIEINPLDALIMCIKIRAGEIQWLSDRMGELDEKDFIENTIAGKQFHLYARERQHAMNDLARYSQMAISLGIAERAVKMAETYGEMLAMYTKGILDDLWPHLDEKGRQEAPSIVRKHLIALDGGRTEPVKRGMAALPAGEEAAA